MARKLCLALLLLALSAAGNRVIADPPNEDGFINCWLVCGPFPNLGPAGTAEKAQNTAELYPGLDKDWLAEHGGEEKIEPEEGMQYQVVFPDSNFWTARPGGVKIAWRAYKSDTNIVNLLKVFVNKELNIDDTKEHQPQFVAGYAYCVVNSPDDREAYLAFGSDDGYKIWLNHRLVAAGDARRGVKIDASKFPVSLKKGRNPLLVKVDQSVGGYGFALRFLGWGPDAIMDDLNITRH